MARRHWKKWKSLPPLSLAVLHDWIWQNAPRCSSFSAVEYTSCGHPYATVSSGWWDSFVQRYANLALSAPAPLSHAMSTAFSYDIIKSYFDLKP